MWTHLMSPTPARSGGLLCRAVTSISAWMARRIWTGRTSAAPAMISLQSLSAPAAATSAPRPPRPLPPWTLHIPTWRQMWAESAHWQAFINSGQLADPQWVPVDLYAKVAARRLLEGFSV